MSSNDFPKWSESAAAEELCLIILQNWRTPIMGIICQSLPVYVIALLLILFLFDAGGGRGGGFRGGRGGSGGGFRGGRGGSGGER